jgi:hypothetical protein
MKSFAKLVKGKILKTSMNNARIDFSAEQIGKTGGK